MDDLQTPDDGDGCFPDQAIYRLARPGAGPRRLGLAQASARWRRSAPQNDLQVAAQPHSRRPAFEGLGSQTITPVQRLRARAARSREVGASLSPPQPVDGPLLRATQSKGRSVIPDLGLPALCAWRCMLAEEVAAVSSRLGCQLLNGDVRHTSRGGGIPLRG